MEEAYRTRTPGSAALAKRARAVIPGGSSHTLRWYDPYPLYVTRAQGPYLWDADDRRFVDFWMGHWALLLGHSPPVVVEALRSQIEQGTQWGHVSELEVRLAELVKVMVPCAERVRFTNTGSEATMYAVRLARGFTGASKVLKLEGGWQGFNTDLVGGDAKRPTVGLPPELKGALATIPFNDLPSATTKVETTPDLAAVIVEPFLAGPYFIPADREYLRGLREACDDKGCVLIFDEVVTGFRMAPGGAQELYDVKPDLATFAKVLGGGLPGAAVAGREDIMELSNMARWNERGKAVAIGGGTFSSNPLSLTAGLATLEHLRSHPEVYSELDASGARLRRSLEEGMVRAGMPVVCTGLGSLFRVHFLRRPRARLRNAAEVEESTHAGVADGAFKQALILEGYYTMHGGGALSTAHDPADLEAFAAAAERVGRSLAKEGVK